MDPQNHPCGCMDPGDAAVCDVASPTEYDSQGSAEESRREQHQSLHPWPVDRDIECSQEASVPHDPVADSLLEVFTPNDPVHGLLHLPKIARAFIDHPLFQRMRQIKQLGVCSRVYPGATHDRFFHSIGTAYLGYQLFKTIRQKQPELGATDRDGLCVVLAGLCHDLGHPAYSHMFEDFVHRLGREKLQELKASGKPVTEAEERGVQKYLRWSHEQASRIVLDAIFKDLRGELAAAGLTSDQQGDDFECINELIDPPKKQLIEMMKSHRLQDGWSLIIKGRPLEKAWLYEIVSNWRSGLDVDKFDYFRRDAYHLGIQRHFDHERYFKGVKVLMHDGVATISPPAKEIDTLRDMLELRKFLHRAAYQHKTVKKLEMHLIDVLAKLDKHVQLPCSVPGRKLSLSEAAIEFDVEAYRQITDYKVESLLQDAFYSDNPDLKAIAIEFDTHILRRNLMRLISAWRLPRPGDKDITESMGPLPLPESEEAVIGEIHRRYEEQNLHGHPKVKPDEPVKKVDISEIRCCFARLHYGMGSEDPISRVVFHNGKGAACSTTVLGYDSESKPLREVIFVFWNPPAKTSDDATMKRLTNAFDMWAEDEVIRHIDKFSSADASEIVKMIKEHEAAISDLKQKLDQLQSANMPSEVVNCERIVPPVFTPPGRPADAKRRRVLDMQQSCPWWSPPRPARSELN